MTKEYEDKIRENLKDLSKEQLIDIICDLCNAYVEARVFSQKRIQKCCDNLQTHIQELNNSLIQKVNGKFFKI